MKEETKESPKKRAMVKLDDTVAMAEKYRKLAMKDIVENMVVNDNVLNFSTMTVRKQPDWVWRKMFAKLSLNWKIYQLEYDFDTWMVNKNEFMEFVAKVLAREILLQNRTIFTTIL